MKEARRSCAPAAVVAALVLLPWLYVGSYLLAVAPAHRIYLNPDNSGGVVFVIQNYRIGGSLPAIIYWPLEQIDRRLRREKWA